MLLMHIPSNFPKQSQIAYLVGSQRLALYHKLMLYIKPAWAQD